jgi:hypothetical protein
LTHLAPRYRPSTLRCPYTDPARACLRPRHYQRSSTSSLLQDATQPGTAARAYSTDLSASVPGPRSGRCIFQCGTNRHP